METVLAAKAKTLHSALCLNDETLLLSNLKLFLLHLETINITFPSWQIDTFHSIL